MGMIKSKYKNLSINIKKNNKKNNKNTKLGVLNNKSLIQIIIGSVKKFYYLNKSYNVELNSMKTGIELNFEKLNVLLISMIICIRLFLTSDGFETLYLISFFFIVFLLVHTVLTVKNVNRHRAVINNLSSINPISSRTMFTLSSLKIAGPVCRTCFSIGTGVVLGSEGLWKLGAGMNSISPWRNYIINKIQGTNIISRTEFDLALEAQSKSNEINRLHEISKKN
jgi:hypothetical protein